MSIATRSHEPAETSAKVDSPTLPDRWQHAALSGLSCKLITYGIVQPGPHIPTGVPFIQTKDLTSGALDPSDMDRTSRAIHSSYTRSAVTSGDIIVGIRASVGMIGYVPEEMRDANISRGVARVSPATHVNGRFLYFALQSSAVQSSITKEVKGSTYAEITLPALRNIEIPFPPTIAEQEAIAEALGDADAWIESLEQLVAKKRHLKQAAMQQLLTGKTRLPGFEAGESQKQTEVGVIPEDWRVTTLGRMCGFENGDRGKNYPSEYSFTSTGIPFVNAGHLEKGKIRLSGLDYISQERFDLLGGGKFSPGDILFCLRGTLGKFGVVGAEIPEGAIASSLVIVRSRPGLISREYLSCYFGSTFCEEMIERWAGGAAQPNLGAQDLARFTIFLPPTLAEQEAIAEVLSDMDAEIEAIEAKLTKARQIKLGMMQELLTGKTRLI